MKTILFILLIFFPIITFSQDVKYRYCRVSFVFKTGQSTQCNMVADSGQVGSINDKKYTDATGGPKEFNSDIEGINVMASKGWEVISTFISPNGLGIYYVLKKRILLK